MLSERVRARRSAIEKGRVYLIAGFVLAGLAGCQTTPASERADGSGPGDDDTPSDADAVPDGAGGSAAGLPSPPDAAAFACDPAALGTSPALQRLTRRQYVNTVQAQLAFAIGDAEAQTLMNALSAELDAVPQDARAVLPEDLHGSYRRLDQAVQQTHAEAWFGVATRVGQLLTEPGRIGSAVGACAVDADAANDAQCLNDFIIRFGARALRRPLSSDEVAFYAGFFGGDASEDPAGYADVVAGLLSAPEFAYHVEHGLDAVPGARDLYRLDAFERAARLSYHFWDAPPDQALWDAAADGSLLQTDVYAAQVDRLVADARTRETTREFFREWLKLERVPQFDAFASSPQLVAFAGGTPPSADFRSAVIDEVLDMMQYYTWQQPGSLQDVLTSGSSFAKTAELAAVYDDEPWAQGDEPPETRQPERLGLLTRAAFLVTGSDGSRPVMRGVFIRQNVLCDSIPAPPAGAASTEASLEGPATTRQQLESITEVQGTSCFGCHQTLINPIGFALEGFDGLGRQRTEEVLLDDQGQEVARLPVDTSTIPAVTSGDRTASTGAADLVRLIADSGKAEACLARHYFRYSFGRWENLATDGCMLESLRRALTEAGSLAGMLKSVALQPSFTERSIVLDEGTQGP